MEEVKYSIPSGSGGRILPDNHDDSRVSLNRHIDDDSSSVSLEDSRTSSSSCFMCVVKCYGKILCGVVLVPACALVESVSFLCVASFVRYVGLVKNIYQRNRILGVVASVTVAPLLGVGYGIITGFVMGFIGGLDGMDMAFTLSPKEFLSSMRDLVDVKDW